LAVKAVAFLGHVWVNIAHDCHSIGRPTSVLGRDLKRDPLGGGFKRVLKLLADQTTMSAHGPGAGGNTRP
jgi:hypothetical protein